MDGTTETLARIETKLDIAISRLDDHETRLRLLESRAGKKWEALLADSLKILLAAGMGFLLAELGL